MLNVIFFCVLATYLSALLTFEQSCEASHGVELVCLLVTLVLICLPTFVSSENVPTEFQTLR